MMKSEPCQQEYDFALIFGGVSELTDEISTALFEAGCDDATFSIVDGWLYAEFSRRASAMKDAIISAIKDVIKASVGAKIIRVDDCGLVTQAEIGRRINRTRQLISQYINGSRGPGNFPRPECQLSDSSPLWRWCAVSFWLAQNNIIRREAGWDAQAVWVINNALENSRLEREAPELVKDIEQQLHAIG